MIAHSILGKRLDLKRIDNYVDEFLEPIGVHKINIR